MGKPSIFRYEVFDNLSPPAYKRRGPPRHDALAQAIEKMEIGQCLEVNRKRDTVLKMSQRVTKLTGAKYISRRWTSGKTRIWRIS